MIYSKYPLKVLQEVEPFPPIQNTDNPYLTESAMHADQANQLQGYGYLVDGVGAFTYLGTVAESSADYKAFGGGEIVKSDWNETDSNKSSFILNNPADESYFPFISKWNVVAQDVIVLPVGINGVNDITVDWGDGNINKNNSHTYNLTGTYNISITGRLEDFRFNLIANSKLNLIEIVDWGAIKFRNINFSGCINLTSYPYTQSPDFSLSTDLNYLFNLTGITRISDKLLERAYNVVYLGSAFSNTPINTVDNKSFYQCNSVITIGNMFQNCNNLISVPEDVFWYMPELDHANSLFESSGIQSLPSKLFMKTFKLRRVGRMLWAATSITSIPYNLFFNCPLIQTFESFARNPTQMWTAPVPALWLYYPNAIGTNAFSSGFTPNSNEVPTSWGGTFGGTQGKILNNHMWTGTNIEFNSIPLLEKNDLDIIKFIQ